MSTHDEKIMVVDDDESVCKLCECSLQDEGYRVVTICDPYQALTKARNDSFDLVLTDVKMPQMTGLELLRRLKQFSPELAVIIMTGFATMELAIEAVKEGAYNFIHKPFNVSEMVVAVKNALERKRLLQENIRLKTLVNLFKFSENIGNTLEISGLFDLVMDVAIKETSAEKCIIFYPDEETEELYIRYAMGLENEIVEQVRLPLTHGVAGKAFVKRHPLLVNISGENDQSHSCGIEGQLGHSILAIPMQNKNRVIGVLSLYKNGRGQFTEADKDIASILASQTAIALENTELIIEQEILFLETMKSLATTLDERDPYTHGHSYRVAKMAVAIGQVMGLDEKELEELELAGILHDIGKIGIRDEILLKVGQLTKEEYEIIKTHPFKGFNILKHIQRLSSVVEAVYSHHEWYNGQGYPRGLAGDAIPLAGAILAVADAFDSITTDRPYRAKKNFQEALIILRECSGTQFNPAVIQALEQVDFSKLSMTT